MLNRGAGVLSTPFLTVYFYALQFLIATILCRWPFVMTRMPATCPGLPWDPVGATQYTLKWWYVSFVGVTLNTSIVSPVRIRYINTITPGRCGSNLTFKLIIKNSGLGIRCEIARRVPQNHTNERSVRNQSTLVEVMAWCCEAICVNMYMYVHIRSAGESVPETLVYPHPKSYLVTMK